MRCVSVIALIACAGLLPTSALETAPCWAAGSDKVPFTVYTNSNDVYVRSGPGKNYYPTDKLPQGEPIEVYRQDPGGWYAIRPPQGSFSWVPSDALKPIGEHIAVVQKDRVVCYVGTRFSNAHDVNQVRLNKGEQVEIMDMKQIGEGPEAQTWCEIAPPSGEFRWVFSKYVDRDPPTGLSHSGADSDQTAKQADWTTKGDSNSNGGSGKNSASVAKGRGAGNSDWQPSAGALQPENKSATVSSDPFQAQLDAIDLQVSQMVSDDPNTWEFTALRRRTENLLPSAGTALERGRVRLVLNRIARFEDVKHRQDLLGDPGSAMSSALASHRPSLVTPNDTDHFDGTGKLTPVISQRPNAPRYALVNDTNQVVSFVTPAPGVDLSPFVGKEVGVNGERGFMPELQKPHVMASRINILDSDTVIR
jgi:SH3-like domain-containing protein